MVENPRLGEVGLEQCAAFDVEPKQLMAQARAHVLAEVEAQSRLDHEALARPGVGEIHPIADARPHAEEGLAGRLDLVPETDRILLEIDAVEEAVATFGGIDILVNNASAIFLAGTLQTPMKRFDLMHAVNVRGTFATSQACLVLEIFHIRYNVLFMGR